MALYTVSITDGTTLSSLAVSAGRGPKGDGWTGVTYDTETGRFTFTSNDGLGYVSDDITVDLDAAVQAAESAQQAAEAAEQNTINLFDQFGDQYLGPKASDPTVDNDGDPLTEGDIYFNTTDEVLKFYSGTAWVAPEVIATTAASEAETSANNAATSEQNVSDSADAAANSASAALTSENNAATSEQNALTSEQNALTSEQNALTSEQNAATSEQNASSSASAALTSENNAATSEQNASDSESAASTSEQNALASEQNASTSEQNAATSEQNAAGSATDAQNAQNAAEAAFDSFDDRYLGSKASAPTTDNDGDTLTEGVLYWNSTSDQLFIWDGSAWSTASISDTDPTFNSVTVNTTVDGRDVGADGSKLDGIEANADVTDTANVTAAGALMDSELTDIAAVKALDQGVATTDSPSFAGVTATTADINGGTIDGTVIGGSTPAAISGTTGTFSGDLTVDTDTLFVDASTNNVGIGTSSPGGRLDVVRDSGGSAILNLIGTNGDANLRLTASPTSVSYLAIGDTDDLFVGGLAYVHSEDSLRILANNAERMRIDSSGNVGIGTSNPFFPLDVSGIIRTTDDIRLTNGASAQVRFTDSTETNGYSIRANVSAVADFGLVFEGLDSADLYIMGQSDPHIWYSQAGVERMRIDASGNVGIGTSSPGSELDVFGIGEIIRSTANNGASNFMAFYDATGRNGYFGYGGASDDMTLANERNGWLRFLTSGSTRMIIDSDGKVGIGTASPSEALTIAGNFAFTNSASKLSVRRGNLDSLLDFDFPDLTNTQGGVRFFRGTNTTGACFVRFYTGDGTTSTDHQITCGGGDSYFQANGGNVGIGTDNPSSTLDVNGSLSKNSGSFKIDHPIKPDTHHLVHSFVEGPQADNLYRGRVTLVHGQATVNLDEAGRMTEGTFVALNGNVQCFTTNEAGWTQVRGSVSGNILTIEAQDPACADEVSWLVIGERHDQHMIDTEWTDENGRVITEPEKTLKGAE